jgi:hypothetical protein
MQYQQFNNQVGVGIVKTLTVTYEFVTVKDYDPVLTRILPSRAQRKIILKETFCQTFFSDSANKTIAEAVMCNVEATALSSISTSSCLVFQISPKSCCLVFSIYTMSKIPAT